MKNTASFAALARWSLAVLLAGLCGAGFAAPPFQMAPYPLVLAPTVKPNLMVILDNSQSMDGTMAGKVISGNDPSTRSNIARSVLRNIIDTNRNAFNWGLTTFETTSDLLFSTQAYYLGKSNTMLYTDTCVNGVSNVVGPLGNLRCIADPYKGHGVRFITYEKSGDDSDVNDVYYTSDTSKVYGLGTGGASFTLWPSRNATTGWAVSDFTGTPQNLTFTPTDAGFFPQAPYSRALFETRGWGYNSNITGAGKIVEPVQAGADAHIARLMSRLADETNGNTGEIKNSAVFTPLTGSLQTVRSYFAQGQSATIKSPIEQVCQSNFVVLTTDGNPTGTTGGAQYNPSQWVNTKDPATGLWTWGQAQQDVFAQISALRSTTLTGPNISAGAPANQNFDIKTYVIGMGDTVANESSVAALHEMARLGNAHPSAFLGNSAASIQSAFQTIVADIKGKTAANAAVALNTGTWTAGASVYQAKFDSTDWSGSLQAYPISAAGVVGATPAWNAAVEIKGQNWDTQRNIITYKPSAPFGSRGIAFRWPIDPASPRTTELDPDQITALARDANGTADSFGAARLAFLRGDPSREARSCGTPPCVAPQFRNRPTTPLGDIVNSTPYYVAAPAFGYFDDFEAAPYSSFVNTYRGRTPVLYVGANDGMLHAIDANTGKELFGYVPAAVYDSLSNLSSLSFNHRFSVDGPPTVGDVYYGGAWHTLLVAGMRAGAKGVYALDVTNPASFAEGNAGSIVRWEFQDPDLGHVFGQPLLVKTNNGRWSVIVSGGYNAGNASGRAMLFVLDAETGALLKKIDTTVGTAASPNGLSAPAAIDVNADGIADVVYAGDLNGNLWKFDLRGATVAGWSLGNGALALFSTPGGQPITVRPDVTRYPGGAYLVGFGTGRYLATDDQSNTAAQSIYAIVDKGTGATVALADLQQQRFVQTATRGGVRYRLSTHAVGSPADNRIDGDDTISNPVYLADKKGWYVNLPTSGERVIEDAQFRGGRLILVTMIPDTSSPCSTGGTGWLIELDALTGNRLESVTFDTNGDRDFTLTDYVDFPLSGSGGNNVSGRSFDAVPSRPATIGSGKIAWRVIGTGDGERPTVGVPADPARAGRAMWREVR